jgi:hypothetical protein
LAMSCQRHAQLLWKCLLGSLELWTTPYFGIIQSWRERDCCIRDVYLDLDISRRFSKCIRRLDGMHEQRCMTKGKFCLPDGRQWPSLTIWVLYFRNFNRMS